MSVSLVFPHPMHKPLRARQSSLLTFFQVPKSGELPISTLTPSHILPLLSDNYLLILSTNPYIHPLGVGFTGSSFGKILNPASHSRS